ncbi:AAA family ATPase [Paramaledivibacter caminithermalis]|jgi:MoxR-like ATPase|uniref:MoxR-like ATPase n=1 Tax=Paramaledivibacter caminithermalis (strain DSM 15212 / CIP 107654 / DViRD3) TaxID=1121301 RepID=A0A1M6JM85_PARC5|nr:MoxR family ATPase [Paramaledivibacter caminithermalis]SHJ47815.1 MoxR-like ATPase [Paramaledivibacter caminithermalis DSM 15212]
MGFSEKDFRDFKIKFDSIKREIQKAIIGQEELIEKVLIAMLCEGNVLLEGVPGLGKTQLVKTIGKVLNLDFSRIQFTPDLMPADILGTNIIVHDENGRNKFEFQKGPVFTNILLADEINRATPKTQSAMLQCMQEKIVTAGNETRKLNKPFFVLATQNPIEMEGTYPLPEAQMDRFLFKLNVEFPGLKELTQIVNLTTNNQEIELQKISDKDMFLNMINISKEIPVSKAVMEYAIKLVLYTHPENKESPEITKKYVRFGSSPRGAQAIIRAAKVKALIEGRFNVAFDDIKYVAYPALRHRIILNFEAISDNVDSDFIINQIIDKIG